MERNSGISNRKAGAGKFNTNAVAFLFFFAQNPAIGYQSIKLLRSFKITEKTNRTFLHVHPASAIEADLIRRWEGLARKRHELWKSHDFRVGFRAQLFIHISESVIGRPLYRADCATKPHFCACANFELGLRAKSESWGLSPIYAIDPPKGFSFLFILRNHIEGRHIYGQNFNAR